MWHTNKPFGFRFLLSEYISAKCPTILRRELMWSDVSPANKDSYLKLCTLIIQFLQTEKWNWTRDAFVFWHTNSTIIIISMKSSDNGHNGAPTVTSHTLRALTLTFIRSAETQRHVNVAANLPSRNAKWLKVLMHWKAPSEMSCCVPDVGSRDVSQVLPSCSWWSVKPAASTQKRIKLLCI